MRYLPSLPYVEPKFALFCTKFALIKFDVNQIFRAVKSFGIIHHFYEHNYRRFQK